MKQWKKGTFPDSLKIADVTPVFKKKDPLNKTKYRPVSVLPIVSKLFEKITQNQVNSFTSDCSYRPIYVVTERVIQALIEKWKKNLDDKGYGDAVLMGLSKAFDPVNHDLLTAKLSAYGFKQDALKLIYRYLTSRRHRTKINSAFSSWEELTQGVPKVLCLVFFYLISISMIYFTFLSVQKCATLLIIRLFTFVIRILALLLIDWSMTVF